MDKKVLITLRPDVSLNILIGLQATDVNDKDKKFYSNFTSWKQKRLSKKLSWT